MLNLQSLLNTEKIINISIVFENIKENQVFCPVLFRTRMTNENPFSYESGFSFGGAKGSQGDGSLGSANKGSTYWLECASY